MPYEPPPEIAGLSLAEIAELVTARKLPPVDQWTPEVTGDSHMRIAADGRWFHEGSEIRRPAMVRAFASILVRDTEDRHWLVTPTQKLAIEVEDAAFVAVDLRHDDGALAFRLNTDDIVIAGQQHPLRVSGDPETPAVYVLVRHGAEARLNRSTWSQLAEIAIERGDMAVVSDGVRFSLEPA